MILVFKIYFYFSVFNFYYYICNSSWALEIKETVCKLFFYIFSVQRRVVVA